METNLPPLVSAQHFSHMCVVPKQHFRLDIGLKQQQMINKPPMFLNKPTITQTLWGGLHTSCAIRECLWACSLAKASTPSAVWWATPRLLFVLHSLPLHRRYYHCCWSWCAGRPNRLLASARCQPPSSNAIRVLPKHPAITTNRSDRYSR